MPSISDSAILAGLAQRDQSALRALIDMCGRHVYGKALRILLEPQLAEQVAQDTLLILWWEPHRFDAEKGSLRSFLMGAARHKAIDLVRQEQSCRSTQSRFLEEETSAQSPSADVGVEDAIVLRSALSNLPLTKREVIFLAYYEGLTYKQVARVLDIPEATVKTRIRDSLIQLRRVLVVTEAT